MGARKVFFELFTSQGCSSCPPADRLLGELATRDDVLPLSFHVTYWDRLGWPDTFGLEASTRRQGDYADSLGRRGVYTPQMVIGGRLDAAMHARVSRLESRLNALLARPGDAGRRGQLAMRGRPVARLASPLPHAMTRAVSRRPPSIWLGPRSRVGRSA